MWAFHLFQKNIASFFFIFPNEISQFKKKRKENNANTLHKVGNNAFGAFMSILSRVIIVNEAKHPLFLCDMLLSTKGKVQGLDLFMFP
jgi:hypothetical protein